MSRHVLIVLRADVAVAVRDLIEDRFGVDPMTRISATRLRRSGDAPGSTSHFCSHGVYTDTEWGHLLGILTDATDGVRDAVSWQGQGQGVAAADARWAVATQAGDVVAAFRLSRHNGTTWESPRTALANAGLVFTWADG